MWDNEQQRSNALQKEAVIEALDAELFKLTQESIQVAENLSTLQMNQNKRAEQIRRLEDLGQPVQRDTTYIVRDRHGRNIRDHNESLDGYTKPVTKRELRTGEIIQMERKLDETTQQIHAFRRKFELAARDALDVTVQRRDTGAALHSSQLTECERLVSTICRLDHEVFLSMSELLGLRLKIMSAQREEVDEIERLERDRIYFESKEEETKKSLLLEMELMKNRIKVELMTDTRDLQAQLKSLNFQISLMKKKEAMADDADKELDAKTERTKKDLVATKERQVVLHYFLQDTIGKLCLIRCIIRFVLCCHT